MTTFEFIFLVMAVIVSVIIILLVLMQKSSGAGASGALMGGDLNLFNKTKERGAEKLMSYLTLSAVILYMTLALALRL